MIKHTNMKVKIIATGEIKEVLKRQSYPLEYIDKEGNIYTCGEADRIWDDSIDWEQRRYEIAKECVSSMICDAYKQARDGFKSAQDNPSYTSGSASIKEYLDHYMQYAVHTSIEYADELIKQLKGE